MSSIGYGDIYAKNAYGRVIVIIACLIGVIISSLLVVAL